MFRVILSLFVVLLSVSCAPDVEQSVKYYDKAHHEQLIKRLKEEGVPYRIASDGQVFYPVSTRDVVKKISAEIIGPVDKSKTGVTIEKKYAEEISKHLDRAGIQYELGEVEGNALFTWDASVNDSALVIVNLVTRESK
jgi:flagellar biosynthesis/type III secretory pathway M-ring protein FliF/YscJ